MKKSNNLFTLWIKLPDKLRFLFIGGANTFISYILYVIFITFLGSEKYQLALIFSWFFSSFTSFVMQKTLVFQSKGNWLKEYVKCILAWSVAYGINAILLEITVRYLGLAPIIGQIFAALLTTVLTYILFKYFAFKKEY